MNKPQETVLFALPSEGLDVVHLMPPQQVAERLDKLYRDVLIEQELYRLMRLSVPGNHRRSARTRVLLERRPR